MDQAEKTAGSGGARIIAALAALCAAALYCIAAPAIGNYAVRIYPALSEMYWPTLIYLWLTAVPLALALWKLWRSSRAADGEPYRDIAVLCYIDAGMYAVGAAALALMDLLHPGVLAMAVVVTIWFIAWGRVAQRLAGRKV